MVHDHEVEMIVVIRLPKFGSYPDVVITIARHQLISADFVPLFSRRDTSCSQRVDAQSNRRAPGYGVFDEFHLFAVVGKKKRTRALQTLLSHDFLIGFYFEVSANGAVGPGDAYYVGARLFAQAE